VHAFQSAYFTPKQKNYELRRTGPTDNVQANIYNPKNKSALHMAANIIVHPHYNGVSKVADLAVLKFAENLNENLTAICLSNKPGRVKTNYIICAKYLQNIWQTHRRHHGLLLTNRQKKYLSTTFRGNVRKEKINR
jgi:hypothetical protein